jgi:hypothetical protein
MLIQTITYVYTDENEPLVEYSVNWKDKKLEIVVTYSLDNIIRPLPSSKFNIESEINQKANDFNI